MRAARYGKRDGGKDPAFWALLISSAVLAVRWYRTRSEAAQGSAGNEWKLTPAETVIPTSRGKH